MITLTPTTNGETTKVYYTEGTGENSLKIKGVKILGNDVTPPLDNPTGTYYAYDNRGYKYVNLTIDSEGNVQFEGEDDFIEGTIDFEKNTFSYSYDSKGITNETAPIRFLTINSNKILIIDEISDKDSGTYYGIYLKEETVKKILQE